MGAALQRFATDTTCNDTRQADGEPHELLSSVDKALAIADCTDRAGRGTRLRPSLYGVTTRVSYITCFRHAARGSQPSAFGSLPDDNSRGLVCSFGR
jgi:hypothetical protein